MLGIFPWLQDFLDGYDIDSGLVFMTTGGVLFYVIYSLPTASLSLTAAMLFALSPIWLPLVTIDLAFYQWIEYVDKQFRVSQGRTTLRIKLPPEVFKSPEAMEVVLTQSWIKQTPDNLYQRYILGKSTIQTSLELVSIGGDVRFYVNVPTKKVKDAFEAQMYAQYPGVEIIEEPVDYLGEIEADFDKWEIFSTHFQKKKTEFQPIKTYIDYGLDKMPKEEEKIDPITPMIEYLGTKVKPYERVIVQFVFKPWREANLTNGQPFGDDRKWVDDAKELVDKILARDSKTKAPLSAEGADFDGSPRISPGERSTVEAIERNIEKYAYVGGIRWAYITPKGRFNGGLLSGFNRLFGQYDLNDRNGLGVRWRTDFNYYMFADPFGTKLPGLKEAELREMKLRKLNPKNSAFGSKIFTVEELATMFHLPGRVAVTPTLGRIESTRATAPANLPISTDT